MAFRYDSPHGDDADAVRFLFPVDGDSLDPASLALRSGLATLVPAGARIVEENRTQQVSLGCGTLILIALIVLIFGGGGGSEVKRKLDDLQREVRQLRTSVEAQTTEIQQLRERVGDQPLR
jgi:hypothetical protein